MTKKIAIVFPGQGSQGVGMLSTFTQPVVEKTFQEASEILSYDLKEIIHKNPDNKLNHTEITQPALLTADVALWRLWCERGGLKPVVLAGHSLGEYAALVCSEVLSFSEALKLVEKRGQFMQEAVPEGQGAMAAIIGLDPSIVEHICEETSQGEVVAPANINAPGQIVIAGSSKAVERAMQKAEEAGARLVKKLEVSVPSHSALMRTAAKKFDILLDKVIWQLPKIPVIHNVDATLHSDIAFIKQALSHQLYSPVQWVKSVEEMVNKYHVESIIECGPGKILTGLNKRIVKVPVLSLSEPHLFEETLEHV